MFLKTGCHVSDIAQDNSLFQMTIPSRQCLVSSDVLVRPVRKKVIFMIINRICWIYEFEFKKNDNDITASQVQLSAKTAKKTGYGEYGEPSFCPKVCIKVHFPGHQ